MSRDLSRYFIVKKYNDGWLMQSQSSPETIFVYFEELVKMGYLSSDIPTSIRDQSIPPTRVITVPIGNSLDNSDDSTGLRINRRSVEHKSSPMDIPGTNPNREVKMSQRLSGSLIESKMDNRPKRSSYPDRTPNYL